MKEYIEREAIKQIIAAQCGECADACLEFDGIQPDCNQCLLHGAKKAIESIPAADVQEVDKLTEAGKSLLKYCPESINQLAARINDNMDRAVLYGKRRRKADV